MYQVCKILSLYAGSWQFCEILPVFVLAFCSTRGSGLLAQRRTPTKRSYNSLPVYVKLRSETTDSVINNNNNNNSEKGQVLCINTTTLKQSTPNNPQYNYVRAHTYARTHTRTHARTHARTRTRTHTHTHTHTLILEFQKKAARKRSVIISIVLTLDKTVALKQTVLHSYARVTFIYCSHHETTSSVFEITDVGVQLIKWH